jgi:hypothetical protein
MIDKLIKNSYKMSSIRSHLRPRQPPPKVQIGIKKLIIMVEEAKPLEVLEEVKLNKEEQKMVELLAAPLLPLYLAYQVVF